jgi:hypothetical protein
MDSAPLIFGTLLFGTLALDLSLRAFWVRPYFGLGFRNFRSLRKISVGIEIDTWKLLTTNDDTFFHSIEYRCWNNATILLREEITLFWTEGMKKRYYTPVIHSRIKYDSNAGLLDIEGRFDPIPSLILFLSVCVPFAGIPAAWFWDNAEFLKSFILLLVPMTVLGFFLAIANVQKARYMRIFEGIGS